MAGMKKRLREMEAENARLRQLLHEAREQYRRREVYWHQFLARHGTPHVRDIVSRESEGVYLAHQILRAAPTPDGLHIEIAKTLNR